MVSLRCVIGALTGAVLLAQTSLAHSLKRNPVNYVSLVDDPLIKTPSRRAHAHSNFDLTFTLHSGRQQIRLALEPNHDLLHEDLAVNYIGEDGEVTRVESVERSSHKVYKGKAFIQRDWYGGWSHAGWARITVHKDGKEPVFEGSFRLDGDTHHIQTAAHYRKLKHAEDPEITTTDKDDAMVVYRDSDIRNTILEPSELKRRNLLSESTCGSESLGFNTKFDKEERDVAPSTFRAMSPRALFGRQNTGDDMGGDAGANYVDTIGSTQGCPTTRKVALVGIATDCNYWEEFDENQEDLRRSVISMVNQASELYESTFSISLGIRNLTIIDRSCSSSNSDTTPWNLSCNDGADLADRLNTFSSWRGRFDDSNAYWTLLTTCETGSAVGLAWRGQLCRQGASASQDSSGGNETVAATNVVVRTSSEWQIFAHETGHTFGAVHDCTDEACPVDSRTQACCPLTANDCSANGRFIMNPSTGESISEFSPCTVGNICSGLARNINGQCLSDNRNVPTIAGSQCGNGIVESGEECDCGGSDSCGENSCCNPDTCRYRDGAVCDPTNEDCCSTECQFSSTGTVCRESNGQCDPEETCPGDSGTCPRDEHLDDGEDCGDGSHCASGQCTSRDLQCRAFVGTGDNDTSVRSCNDRSCLLSCEAPDYGVGTCGYGNQNFLDGTGCGGGGRCQSGNCEGRSTWREITGWLEDNKNIAIPVGVVLAVLLLIAILSCFWSCVKRCRRKRTPPKPRSPPTNMSSRSVAPDQGYYNNNHPSGPWASGGVAPPPPPPPNYTYQPVSHVTYDEPNRWTYNNRSTRYA